MIYTITLNPAIDKTIILEQLNKGKVNRVLNSRIDVGGKGINVSKVLRLLGARSVSTGILGKDNAEIFIDYLENSHIGNNFNIVGGKNRTNLKIVEEKNKVITDVNDSSGFKVSSNDFNRFLENLLSLVREGDIVVISGSLPEGLDDNIYGYIINELKQRKIKTVLDADREALLNGINAVPYAIKPNINELKHIIKVDEKDLDSIVRGGEYLLEKGIEKVLISLGKKGSVYITKANILFSEGLEVPVKSTVGAGDSMVASLVYGIINKFDDFDILKLATACATAKVMTEGTDILQKKLIEEIYGKVKVKILERSD